MAVKREAGDGDLTKSHPILGRSAEQIIGTEHGLFEYINEAN